MIPSGKGRVIFTFLLLLHVSKVEMPSGLCPGGGVLG